jgi:GNAT superfamily N-acetyltransferase
VADGFTIERVSFERLAGLASRAWVEEQMPMRQYTRPAIRLGAFRDGQLVGCVTVVQHGGYGRLCSLYVMPEARNVGIGAALIAAAIEESRDAGVTQLEARSLHETLFQLAGFTMTAKRFAPLPDGRMYRQFVMAL